MSKNEQLIRTCETCGKEWRWIYDEEEDGFVPSEEVEKAGVIHVSEGEMGFGAISIDISGVYCNADCFFKAIYKSKDSAEKEIEEEEKEERAKEERRRNEPSTAVD